MQLSRSENLLGTMTGEVSCSSGQWIQQESTPVVQNMGKNARRNVSVQTGEEFSLEFLQDCGAVRRVPSAPDTVLNCEKGAGLNYNQNSTVAYQDLSGILGLKRMESECASDTSGFVAANGSCKEIENEAHVDKLSIHSVKEVDGGEGSRKAVGELNCDRAGFRPTAPPVNVSESPHSNNFNRSGVLHGSQSGKMKFLCSFGGKILPRPSDGKLRYVGGETRFISIRNGVSWEELVKKTSGFCSQPHVIKYQLPNEDLDALISVSSDEDLQNMIEEYHGLERHESSQRPRVFLIPLGESENCSIEVDTIHSSNPDYQYVAAVNDLVDPSSRKTSGGQNLSSEASQQGTKTLVFHKEIQSNFKALHHSQILSESQNMTGSSIQSPLSPIPHQQADDRQWGQSHGGHCHNHNHSKTVVSTSAVGQNFGDFDGFSREMPVHKESRFLSDKPVSQPEDLIAQLSGSIGCHHGMPHALSDSKLQENGGRSAYCSQEGMNLSHSLNFANTQLLSFQNSGIAQEKPTQLHENSDPFNPWVQNKLEDIESVGLQRRLDLPNSSPCLESLGRNEHTQNGSGDVHDKFRTAIKKDSMTLELPNKLNEKDIFLHHDDTLYGEISPVTGVECPKRLPNINPNITSTFASGVVVPAASDFIPLVDNTVHDPKNFQLGKTPASLLVTSEATANDQDCALTGMVNVEQGHAVSAAKNPEVSGRFPSTREHSCDGRSLGDLISGLSNGPISHEPVHPQFVASQHDIGFQEPLLTSSANFYPSTVLDDLEFQKSDHMVLQKPIQNAAFKREVSLLDDDFVCYPATSVENLSLNGENVSLAQTQAQTMSNHKGQLDTVITAEDVNSGVTPGIQSLFVVSPYVVDESIGDLISPTATEVESIIQESEFEDGKGDMGDKNDSFSDAMIVEMEATLYGLQIIRNADLEELRELGSGTYGTVYHGKWRGSDVAIKRIKKGCFAGRSSGKDQLTKDFWREAQILSNLHHPNVVAFYGIVPDGAGGTLATVAEYMVNGSLRHALLKKNRSLDRRKKLIIAMDAAFGMEYLHSKNIVHFDLKCDNLLVNLRDPQRPICKVGDFGLSRIKRNTLVSGGVRGTLPWMAPELLNGSSSRVSEKVDVFSFGISMWEILTGEEPYANMHCGAIIGGIVKNTLRPPIPERCDSEWRTLMEECWSPDPESRPSFTEITNKLRAMSNTLQGKASGT
ncbi:uncharacterized protein LOC133741521 [Rosa rugosa]|uniref:uncharacterized protein LOC133741521 n=1 Tax=Rosa rugosa TaxID=74645 RepID=UPI002B40325B|nr:uncharacterized protein LOC133741521 [Rosa rugosa]